MFLFFQPIAKPSEQLEAAVTKFKKSNNVNEQLKIISIFLENIPPFTDYILYKTADKLLESVIKSNSEGQPSKSVINLLYEMTTKYEETIQSMKQSVEALKHNSNLQTGHIKTVDETEVKHYNPYPYLSKASHLYDNLFTMLPTKNQQLIKIISGLFSYDTLKIIQWIKNQKDINNSLFMNLINMVIESKNKDASNLLYGLSSHKDITQQLIPCYNPIQLKKFPVTFVLDMMFLNKQINEAFQPEFENWILNNDSLDIADVGMISSHFQSIWKPDTMLQMLVKSEPSEKFANFKFLMSQDLTLCPISDEIIQEISNDIFNESKSEFRDIVGGDIKSTRETYIFLRLLILSLVDQNKLSDVCKKKVVEFVKDDSEYISVAAVQCLMYWMLNEFNITEYPEVVYQITTKIHCQDINQHIRYLYCLALHLFGRDLKVAAAIIQSDELVRFQPKFKIYIGRSIWCFNHLKNRFDEIMKIEVIDYNLATKVIDIISDHLFNSFEEEEEQIE